MADAAAWDRRYLADGPAPATAMAPPTLADHEHHLPRTGTALELACGRGRGAVWLAERGLDVVAVDWSPAAIKLAEDLADSCGSSDRCRFLVHDLDDGLPPGPQVDVILVHLFRDPRLDVAIIERLRPGGVLATTTLSEVGHGPGNFRAAAGDLRRAFTPTLEVLVHHEADGRATFIGRRPIA